MDKIQLSDKVEKFFKPKLGQKICRANGSGACGQCVSPICNYLLEVWGYPIVGGNSEKYITILQEKGWKLDKGELQDGYKNFKNAIAGSVFVSSPNPSNPGNAITHMLVGAGAWGEGKGYYEQNYNGDPVLQNTHRKLGTTYVMMLPPTTDGIGDTAPPKNIWTVQKGETLRSIARLHYGDSNLWKKIYEANKKLIGANPNLILPGQELVLP